MADDIAQRLKSHANAFDGLLSLIPAKLYQGEDTSDQWQRKKQTKEEARNAKKAKLDPDASKTAKDIVEGSKATETESQDEVEDDKVNGDDKSKEKPEEKLKDTKRASKKASKENAKNGSEKKASKKSSKIDTSVKSNQAAVQTSTESDVSETKNKKTTSEHPSPAETKQNSPAKSDPTAVRPSSKSDVTSESKDEKPVRDGSSSNETKHETSQDTFSKSNQTETQSSTETDGASDTNNNNNGNEKGSSGHPSSDELRQRLQKRIEELRAARRADGIDGKPAKNRQELIEARRKREEARKAHKKELKRQAQEEEQRKNDEAIAKRFSPRGSLLSSPCSPAESIASSIANNFSFGRVAFADGQQAADSTLTSLRENKKRKGPSDPKTALTSAEAKKARLDAADAEKRAEIEEKDMWLNAKKRAHGEKVKDNISLLKKSVKRQEGIKKKGEKEWKDRLSNVAKGKEARQTKRDENLRKRREEKGNKGKKKTKGRAGFEGKR